MDLGTFADEVLEAVAGICGDTVVETHKQAADVLDALCRRPGTDKRELAAVFGLSHETLARSREIAKLKSEGEEERRREQDPVWSSLCSSDAVYTWNVLIERINHAAHWREEFREMANRYDEDDSGSSDGEADDLASGSPTVAPPEPLSAVGVAEDGAEERGVAHMAHVRDEASRGSAIASRETRAKARELIERRLEPAPDALRRRLAARLDADLFERCPAEREYRHLARTIVANMRRNTMLAAGYATGRVPPQWLVLADAQALAPRLMQFQRRILRVEGLKEAREDEESAETRRKMWSVAKGQDLQPPAESEDVLP